MSRAVPASSAPDRLAPLALAIAFAQIGLSSVGGASAPLRYVLVTRRRWLSETEFSEVFGIAQACPGPTAVNLAVMVADRFGGWPGIGAALAGLGLPSMVIAIGLAAAAHGLSATSPRFAAAETAVTAAVAGLFISNGVRLAALLWSEEARTGRFGWGAARLGLVLAGIALIAIFHLWIPLAVVVLGSSSLLVEWRARRPAA